VLALLHELSEKKEERIYHYHGRIRMKDLFYNRNDDRKVLDEISGIYRLIQTIISSIYEQNLPSSDFSI
jgi:hypothetical protein